MTQQALRCYVVSLQWGEAFGSVNLIPALNEAQAAAQAVEIALRSSSAPPAEKPLRNVLVMEVELDVLRQMIRVCETGNDAPAVIVPLAIVPKPEPESEVMPVELNAIIDTAPPSAKAGAYLPDDA